MNLYLEMTDMPDFLAVKVYTIAGRLINSSSFTAVQSLLNPQIVHEGSVANFAVTVNLNLTDANSQSLSNGLYYYVLKARKREVEDKVYGKLAVLR